MALGVVPRGFFVCAWRRRRPPAQRPRNPCAPAVAAPKPRVNPFYVLLVGVGILFFFTAFLYGVMTLRAMRGALDPPGHASSGLLQFMDQHGAWLLAGELAILALATVGAMVLDQLAPWRRPEKRPSAQGSTATDTTAPHAPPGPDGP